MGRRKPRTPTMTPEGEVSLRREIVAANTDIMRLDDHPLWARFRELLEARGVDPYATALADSERALVGDFEEGMVVTRERRVYRYTFDWEGATQGEGTFAVWRDITGNWPYLTSHSQGTPHRDAIAAALDVLSDER